MLANGLYHRSKMEIIIREATVTDIPPIQKIIKHYARQERVLARSFAELYECTRDFFVAQSLDGEIIGCCALHIVWEDLAEIKSLVVTEKMRGQGIGTQLIKQCLQSANKLGIKRVFVLTYETDFFKSKGFKLTEKSLLPHKVWNECIRCVHFPDCNELALIYETTPS